MVFVVGCLLLTPAASVLFGPSDEQKLERVADVQETAKRLNEDVAGDPNGERVRDPLDELRDRYARGEIDEEAFERRLEGLLETEGLEADDEDAIRRAVDRLDGSDGTDGTDAGSRGRSGPADPDVTDTTDGRDVGYELE